MKTLYLDFDCTIVNTIKAIVSLYNEDFKYYKNFKYINWIDINTWNFTECNCASAEYKTYNTEFGVWYYGTALVDLENADDKSVIILTPDGYRDVVNKLSKKPISIYLYANNATIKKRLKKRGDDQKEAERRILHDNEDFKGIENEVDKIVYNNESDTIDGVIQKILKYVSEVKG